MGKIGYVIVLVTVLTIQAGGEEADLDILGQWYVQPHVLISSQDKGVLQDSIVDMPGFPLVWEFLPNKVLNIRSAVNCDTSCSFEQRTGIWERGEMDNTLFIMDIERVRWKSTLYLLDEKKYLLVMHRATQENSPRSVSIWTITRD